MTDFSAHNYDLEVVPRVTICAMINSLIFYNCIYDDSVVDVSFN